MQIGEQVKVKPGTMDALRKHGFVDDYITESVDGQTGTILDDHRDVVTCPHWGVDLGFEFPVGIPEQYLEVI